MTMPHFPFRLADNVRARAFGRQVLPYLTPFHFVATFVSVLSLTVSAEAITISTDTVIGAGSSLNGEFIEVVDGTDGPTTVHVIEGGSVRGFEATENSQVIINGGINTWLSRLKDHAQLTMRAGQFGCFESTCSAINVSTILTAFDDSQLHFFGGEFGEKFDGPDEIALVGNNTVNFYGRNLSVQESLDTFFVSGEFGDGTPISVILISIPMANPQVLLHEVPEPNALTLAIGCMSVVFRFARRYGVGGQASMS